MGNFNGINRGVYIADNLDFLRSLNDECIDLICIDPPFAKNETFEADKLRPPLEKVERDTELRLLETWNITNAREAQGTGIQWPAPTDKGTAFKDIWSWENDIHEDWLKSIENDYPIVHNVIEMIRLSHSDSMAAYLCYMAIRIIEMHRILRPTGSMYMHCDYTANAYLRQLMTAIFGEDRFRNEIVWQSTSAHSDSIRYGANTETILFYTKGSKWTWNTLYGEYEEKYKARFSSKDSDGRVWTDDNLTAKGLSGGGYEYEYKGARSLWRVPIETMRRLDAEGRLHFTSRGGIRRKRYLDEMPGRPIQQLWTDISPLNSQARERTGYPTQKPVALAERIIQASTKPGDIVLDCFAGCAYVGVASERLNRQWVACDINPRAWTVFKRQFNKPTLALLNCHDVTTGQQVLGTEPTATIHGPNQLPIRETPISDIQPKGFVLPERKFKVPASIIPEKEMMEKLLEMSGYVAWCCGFANRRPDGSIVKTTRNFHLDHIDPKSKDGSNDIENRAPLCPHHNIRKNNRRVHLADYRVEIADAGEMLVNSIGELINLAEAREKSKILYAQAYAAKHPLI